MLHATFLGTLSDATPSAIETKWAQLDNTLEALGLAQGNANRTRIDW